MNPILYSIKPGEEKNVFCLSVSLEKGIPANYLASFDDSDPRAKFCTVESELFMALSNSAHQRFGDCTVYQMELMAIIGAFAKDELQLQLPVSLGTTVYCNKPSFLKSIQNKLLGRLTILRWKLGFKRPTSIAKSNHQ